MHVNRRMFTSELARELKLKVGGGGSKTRRYRISANKKVHIVNDDTSESVELCVPCSASAVPSFNESFAVVVATLK